MWNHSAERVFGWRAEQVMGKPIPIVPQDAQDEFKALRGRVLEGEGFAGLELRRQRKDGRMIDVLMSTAPLRDDRNRIIGIMASVLEITEQKLMESRLTKLNRLYAFLSEANASMVRVSTRQQLFDRICRTAVEKGGFRTAWIGLLDEQTREVKPMAIYGMTEGIGTTYKIYVDDVHTAEGQGPTGKAVRQGRLFLSSDIDKDPDMAIWRDYAAKVGIRSAASIPIKLKGKVIGALAIYAAESDFFQADERGLLEEVGSDISYALDSLAREEERKRVQSTLRKEATFTSTTLDTAGALIVVLDREGTIVRFNKQGEKVTKYSADEVVGKPLLDVFIHQDDRNRIRSMLADILGGKYPIECTCDWVTKDGDLRTIDWTYTALPEKDGSVKFVIASGVDVTDRIIAEGRLRESEEQLRLVTDNMMDMLTRIDDKGIYVYVSPSHKLVLGWEPTDLLGRNFVEFVHPDDAEGVLKVIEQHVEEGEHFGVTQFRYLRADGEYIWVESSGSALIDKDGHLLGGVFATRDISLRMRAEETLRRRTAEAEQAKLRAQMFLDFMSHDISNIVTPMLTYANLINESDQVPAGIKKYASKIETQIKRVGQFTANVRRLSASEMAASSGFKPIDLKKVFEEAEHDLLKRHPKKKVEVRSHFPDGEVLVPGSGHIEDVVEHLLENSAKHTKEDRIEIDVNARLANGRWEVSISDNGPGIPDSEKKLIVMNSLVTQSSFERGIASGLSFTSLVVEQLGGYMRIEDRVQGDHSKGTKVVMTLPNASTGD
jgi:PAS domain S-box-containing protein